MSGKVILAYSGGLDTSVILRWLMEEGYEVLAYIADVGQQQDFAAARTQALRVGATKVFVEDLRQEFVDDYILQLCKANALYEGRYRLGTAAARPLIAKRQIELARREGAAYVSHGATGKGNDQVRFELSYYALEPGIKVLAPWKLPQFLQQFSGRDDLLAYAEKHGIPLSGISRKRPYSEDENLMHISHEAGILEDPNFPCPEEVYSRSVSPQRAPDIETLLELEFCNGLPVRVTNLNTKEEHQQSLALFSYLNQVGRENGVGRLDMVENRFVGIKSRGVYETPGATILHAAHLDLEGITMDREVLRLRDVLALKMAELVYYGFWFSPEMEFIRAAIDHSQRRVEGCVTVSIYKGNVYPVARKSPASLYDPHLSSMNVEGGYNQQDAGGFIRINAIRLMAHRRLVQARQNAKGSGGKE